MKIKAGGFEAELVPDTVITVQLTAVALAKLIALRSITNQFDLCLAIEEAISAYVDNVAEWDVSTENAIELVHYIDPTAKFETTKRAFNSGLETSKRIIGAMYKKEEE